MTALSLPKGFIDFVDGQWPKGFHQFWQEAKPERAELAADVPA